MLGSEITAVIVGIPLALLVFALRWGHSMPLAAQPSGRRAKRTPHKPDSEVPLHCAVRKPPDTEGHCCLY